MILTEAIQIMTNAIVTILADHKPIIYLFGSVALDDFQLGWSDIDILVLTNREITEQKAETLVDLRQALLKRYPGNPYFRLFEGGMLSVDAFLHMDNLNKWTEGRVTEQATELARGHAEDPTKERVVYWGTSGQRITDSHSYRVDSFGMAELLDSGILLHGDDLRGAMAYPTYAQMRSDIIDHVQAARTHGVVIGWLLDIARGIYTLRTGRIITKTAAGEWALENKLCPDADILHKTIQIRKEPQCFTKEEKTVDNAVIQRFADVLDAELSAAPMVQTPSPATSLSYSPSYAAEIAARLSGYTCTKDHIGCSSAGVFRYEHKHNGDVLYLKVAEVSDEIRRERDLLAWLKGKVPVPDVVYYGEQGGHAFLLMTKAGGFMACDCTRDNDGDEGQDKVHEPIDQTVKLLADALLMLQSIVIQDCPYENTLDHKLKAALYNIEHDLVDMDDFEEGNDFNTPMELYQWLVENRPPEELCFTHGDFCLPNIFIDGQTVTGFIDIGRSGIADKWQDIALCVRSLRHNLRHTESQKYIDLLFAHLGIQPDEGKIHYYIMLDELF